MKVLFCPTKAGLARRTPAFPKEIKDGRTSGLENIETGGDLILVALADRNLVAKEVDRVAPDVVDLCDVYDIGPVDLEEIGAHEFFFHVLERAISDVVLPLGDELHIVAHAFEEEDIIFFQLDELVLGLYEEKVGVGYCCGRLRGSGCCGDGLWAEFLDGFLEPFVSKGFFQVVVDMILKGVESVFGLGGGENDLWGIGEAVEQIEAGCAGHLNIEEEQIDLLLIEEVKRIHYVHEMPFDLDEVALLTELTKKIRGDLDIFYYNTRQFHPELNDLYS
jgi:hypothetical protein